jgi:GTPase
MRSCRLVDTRNCRIVAGSGGDGLVSFRQGLPCGGSGGRGGDVRLRCSARFSSLKHLKADEVAGSGRRGNSSKASGARGEDKLLEVPRGVLVWKENRLLGDLDVLGAEIVLANGGLGGCGNNKVVSDKAGKGHPGEEWRGKFELKAIADVGLVPNAGKSSLLGAISRAAPKVASYPFTTLAPHVGTVQYADGRSLTVADLPGLVEGAHANVGLGHEFLRHIERTSLLVYVVDATQDPVHALMALRNEVSLYSEDVAEKRWMVVCTKCDGDKQTNALQSADDVFKVAASIGCDQVIALSAHLGHGLKKLVAVLGENIFSRLGSNAIFNRLDRRS